MNTSPWNKGRIVGQKRPLQISHIWGIRIRLELEGQTRDLALFNMALDSNLRGCDLVKLKVSDVAYGTRTHNADYSGSSAPIVGGAPTAWFSASCAGAPVTHTPAPIAGEPGCGR